MAAYRPNSSPKLASRIPAYLREPAPDTNADCSYVIEIWIYGILGADDGQSDVAATGKDKQELHFGIGHGREPAVAAAATANELAVE